MIALIALALFANATPIKECVSPSAPEWKAFCNDIDLQKMYGSAMQSHARLGKPDEASNWPRKLVEDCKGGSPTCMRDKVLRYMMGAMPLIETMQKQQPASSIASSEEGSRAAKQLVGSFKQKDKYNVQIFEAKPGALFAIAEFSGPYDPEIKMAGSRCRFVGGANFTSPNKFTFAIPAITAPLCHLILTTDGKRATFTPQDESCDDFCGPAAIKKSYEFPLAPKAPVEDEKWMREQDEFKKAFKS